MTTTTYTVVNGVVLSQNKDGVVHHLVSDPLGSVVMVRDNAGNTVYEAEYDPYGNVQSETGTNPSEFGYVGTLGYVKDSASSLYVRARYLLTNLGRWLTKDPLWPSEPGFVYAGAVPVTFVDPSGMLFGYGNYCGPRNGNGGTAPPIDLVDSCCKTHDDCLKSPVEWCLPPMRCMCDCTLAVCITLSIVKSCGSNLKCYCGALAVLDYALTNCITCSRFSPIPIPPLSLPYPISMMVRTCFIFG